VTNSGAGAATLTVGGNNTSTTFTGTLQNGASALGLAKTGTGTLTLSGVNTYRGGTTVNGGTLAVSADNNPGERGRAPAVGERARRVGGPVGRHQQPCGDTELGRRHLRHQWQQRHVGRDDRRRR